MKYSLLKEYLQKLDNNDVVVFTDAYDVFFVENENTILNKFYKFRKPIVFGNQNGLLTNISMNKCNQNNLNSGSYIGYVKYLKILLNIIYQPKLYKKLINNKCSKKVNLYKKYILQAH